ncbi:MAG: hypothetical protein U0Z44_16695 [Kouleothrix sp.]
MTHFKPHITGFMWHDLLMAISWENLERAFEITRQDGMLLLHQPGGPGTFWGSRAAIGSEQFQDFVLRIDTETNLAEVVLKVTYSPGEKCLGVTDRVAEAKRWVADTNDPASTSTPTQELVSDRIGMEQYRAWQYARVSKVYRQSGLVYGVLLRRERMAV